MKKADLWLVVWMLVLLGALLTAFAVSHATEESEEWMGLRIAEPNDCSDAYKSGKYDNYDRDKWLPRLMLYAPYSDHRVREVDRNEYQLEHIVARKEAHISGACRWGQEKRKKFINDPLNMVLATGPVNASKGDDDAAGWLPDGRGEEKTKTSSANLLWFCQRVIDVKLDYGLSIDPEERDALEKCLNG